MKQLKKNFQADGLLVREQLDPICCRSRGCRPAKAFFYNELSTPALLFVQHEGQRGDRAIALLGHRSTDILSNSRCAGLEAGTGQV